VIDQRWTTSSPTAKDRRQYGYDRDSNRLYAENMVDSTRSELYAYDGFNQLTSTDRGTLNGAKTSISGSSRSQAWDYDGLGNWDSQTTDGASAVTRSHNKQNEITGISGASTPSYDANGNLLTDEAAKQFVYDAWNQLVIVKSSGGSTLATYKYDAIGRRVRETRSGVNTDLFYSDEWQVLEERIGSDVKKSYVWSPAYVDAMVARDRDTDNNGSLDERLYAAHDANFNVVALLDTGGAVVERFAYDAFGVFSVLTPAWGSRGTSSYGWNYLHQGGRWDADGTVYSFRLRDYSPTLGRWLQVDPIGFAANEVNYYRAYNNTVPNSTDALGLAPQQQELVEEKGEWFEVKGGSVSINPDGSASVDLKVQRWERTRTIRRLFEFRKDVTPDTVKQIQDQKAIIDRINSDILANENSSAAALIFAGIAAAGATAYDVIAFTQTAFFLVAIICGDNIAASAALARAVDAEARAKKLRIVFGVAMSIYANAQRRNVGLRKDLKEEEAILAQLEAAQWKFVPIRDIAVGKWTEWKQVDQAQDYILQFSAQEAKNMGLKNGPLDKGTFERNKNLFDNKMRRVLVWGPPND